LEEARTKMKKNLLSKILVIGLLLLFIGASISGIGGAINIKKIAGGMQRGWTTTEVVSTESSSHSSFPSVVVDSGGMVHVAWRDLTDYGGSGTDFDIFYKYRDNSGVWSTTEVVSTDSTEESRSPSLALDSSGTIHVAWRDDTNYGGSGTDKDIFYNCRDATGVWSTTEVVSTESAEDSHTPSLDVESDGTVHVAWRDNTNYGGAGSEHDIFYKYRSNAGTWSATEVVSTESSSDSDNPSLAVENDGTVHVAWDDMTDYSSSGTDFDIFYKYKSTGVWSTTEVVSTESTQLSFWPSLKVDSDKNIHVIWDDWTDYGGAGVDEDIFYKVKTSSGWSATEVVSTESTEISYQSSLDVDISYVHVAWKDSTVYGGSGVDADIFYKYKSTGVWSATEVVSTESTAQSEWPSLNIDTVGKVHVAWGDFTDYSGSGNDIDVFYKNNSAGGGFSDLYCDGSLSWTDVKPGELVTGTFTVENIGATGSLLDWEIIDWPTWGTWTFSPSSGNDLKPSHGTVDIYVEVRAPNQKNQQFTGEVRVTNKDDATDYCIIDVSLATPKNKAFNTNLLFLRFLEQHPHIFPMLRHMLGL
jgi:hypothetical protein